jgi:cob(I)yrinic acid a,c-diamide adenosyltransferase
MEDKGYIQIYTGNGKGKTTCALGLSLRAICNGYSVFFGQFLKGQDYSELKAVESLQNFTIRQYGTANFVFNNPSEKDIQMAKEGLSDIKREMLTNNYDIIVMDEVNIAIHKNLITVDDVIDILKLRPENTEMILTGRYAHEKLIEIADLVTEMKEIKHYYTQGVMSRAGIER